MYWTTPALPPRPREQRAVERAEQVDVLVRPERIGPTGSASCEWNTAAKRVRRPSTISSNTMSAWLSPAAGAVGASTLSIFTTSAGRSARSSPGRPAATPVSGSHGRSARRRGRRHRRGRRGRGRCVRGRCVDVVGGAVVAGAVVDGRRGGGGRRRRRCRQPAPPAQRPTSRPAATRATRRGRWAGRGVMSELSQQRDPLLERRVGVEQTVDRP